ncbi:hypothetical protein [Sorangium sp. So ce131]|uniref:hypothetical protein n=1 Tax=Sorangium sp. So ce131 TaxID=3133282 RepID=UPI003F646FEB
MVEREGTSRSITLEELAAIAGALDAGMPRDEVLAGAGLSSEAWEAAQERWMSRLAAQAARGQLRSSQRYLELVAEQKRRAQAKVQALRRKLEGAMPVAPAAHVSPLQEAGRGRATPPPAAEPRGEAAAEARGEAAAGSPWARGLSSGQDAARTPAVERAATPEAASQDQDITASCAVSPLAARKVLPFTQPTPPPAADSVLPFARPTPSSADSALPFARPTPSSADSALPFARPTPSPPADPALPFARSAPPPPPNPALPFARPTPSPPADPALPFARSAPPPPADPALPFARPTPPSAADPALPFARPARPPEVSPRARGKTMALPPQQPTGSWALPFQPSGAAGGPPADTSDSQPAAPAHVDAEAEVMDSVQRITLAQYVYICARAREDPDQVHMIQQQYGLNPMSWTTLHLVWRERFQRDPALRARWKALLDEHAQR